MRAPMENLNGLSHKGGRMAKPGQSPVAALHDKRKFGGLGNA